MCFSKGKARSALIPHCWTCHNVKHNTKFQIHKRSNKHVGPQQKKKKKRKKKRKRSFGASSSARDFSLGLNPLRVREHKI